MASRTASPSVSLKGQWYVGVAGLKQLRSDWCELASDAQIFARYEWNLAIATHLVGNDQSISFCRISDDRDRPLAIIPAFATRVAVKPFGELAALTLGPDGQLAAFDFPMAREANPSEIGAAMLDAFKKHSHRWQVISWLRTMADSNAARVATALDRRLTDIIPAKGCNTFYTASTPDPASGYEVFKVKSSSLRRNLANRSRHLAQHGPIEMRMAREQGNLESFFEEFLRIEASGWKGEGGTRTAITFAPDARAFYRSLLAESSPDFQTDIALLFTGEKAVAGEFLIRTGGWEHIYKIGYDVDYTKGSPGQLLLQLVIERAKASEFVDRVSLVTNQDWHKDWAPIPEPALQVCIFRNKLRPIVVRQGRRILQEYKEARRRFAERRVKGGGAGQEQSKKESRPATE
jgi:CelD/BcsL family acetyltransferase involved in cellulose biosynthesis